MNDEMPNVAATKLFAKHRPVNVCIKRVGRKYSKRNNTTQCAFNRRLVKLNVM